MDLVYCNEQCPIGIQARNKILDQSNSAFDAVFDFRQFVEDCSKDCPYQVSKTDPISEN